MSYIGKLEIEKLYPFGFSVKFGMDAPEKPNVLYAELEDDDFIDFIKSAIRDKYWHLKDWGLLREQYPFDCEPRNTTCSCNDKG